MDSLLVLTGVTTPADLLAAPADRRPTYVAADLGALSTPDEPSRVPDWGDGAAMKGRWRVTVENRQLVLSAMDDSASGHGDEVDALRALARAAWQCPEWTEIRTGDAGQQVLTTLRLGH